MTDLVKAIGGDKCEMKVIGIRPGEKLHEVMISPDDARQTIEYPDHYVIEPQFPWWGSRSGFADGGKEVADQFVYSSDRNDWWLTVDELRELARPMDEMGILPT
jgi:UDP-N-acetylglucosamine 4,6-dehydratase